MQGTKFDLIEVMQDAYRLFCLKNDSTVKYMQPVQIFQGGYAAGIAHERERISKALSSETFFIGEVKRMVIGKEK